MKIKIPQSAIDAQVLRVWLQHIPVPSGQVQAYRLDANGQCTDQVGVGYIYGKGEGSIADEASMLSLPIRYEADATPLKAGDILELRLDGKVMPDDIQLKQIL